MSNCLSNYNVSIYVLSSGPVIALNGSGGLDGSTFIFSFCDLTQISNAGLSNNVNGMIHVEKFKFEISHCLLFDVRCEFLDSLN
jgi:hypothetical protein